MDVNAGVTHVHRGPVDAEYPAVVVVPFGEALRAAALPELDLRLQDLAPDGA